MQVTLVTGDRVVLPDPAGDPMRVSVIPADGRERVAFRKLTVGGHLHVVPSDVAGLVAKGVLDPRLFDVTLLVESGYDDAARDTVPLIVSTSGIGGSGDSGPRTLRRADGAEVVRALPVIDSVAVEVDKAEAAAFLADITTGGAQGGPGDVGTLAAGITRVWLDGPVEALLEESVPQIGAPAAWEAGYTGSGVTVAVLDTGVDAEHPDLAERVVGSKNFTDSSDLDMIGHGSHVASTVAGTGAASDGRYTGVAPEADLLDGKVLDDFGYGTESQIIAGMEWATVEQGADVVNLSLGASDYPWADLADDPMRLAVDRLTDQTGALFAIAAGNAGPGGGRYGTIGTPGNADAAITVGAVDKSDELTWFSSTGPRTNDGGLKPDITGPGEQITAADSYSVFGSYYWTLDGTSMATPHVAGAAALLKQRNPGWDADELKAALMSSADPHPDLSIYEQGAGRVDVERALTQSVFSVPASINFGSVRWPHTDDESVTRELTYRNDGDTDLILSVEAELTDPDGVPAPTGSVDLSAAEVSVPAGGTATVRVTLDTGHDGPDGLYTGRVTAAESDGGTDVSLVTPIAVDKEVESYDVTFRSTGRDGETAVIDTVIFGAETVYGPDELVAYWVYDTDGPVTLRLPKGDYLVDSWVYPDDVEELSLIVQPNLELDADTTFVADARDARPFDLEVERDSAELYSFGMGYIRHLPFGSFEGGVITSGFDGLYAAHLGPELGAEEFVAGVAASFAEPGDDYWFTNTPYVYAVSDRQAGRFWTGHTASFADRDLARVSLMHHSQVAGGSFGVRYLDGVDPETDVGTYFYWELDLPSKVTLYTSGDLRWYSELEEYVEHDNGDLEFVTWQVDYDLRAYTPGRRYTEHWNNAVFGPALQEQFISSIWIEDLIEVYLPPASDGSGHLGDSTFDSGSTVLYRNGKSIAEVDEPGYVLATSVPGERAEFRLEMSAERSRSRFSTEQHAVWEFTADPPGADDYKTLPLWTPRITPKVNGYNVSTDRRAALIPIEFRPEVDADVGRLRRPKVWASFDDGDTWRRVRVLPARGENTWRALILHPKKGGKGASGSDYVSLRTAASDSHGNSVDYTVIHAYALR